MITTLVMLALKSVLVTALALAALRLTRDRSAAERSTIAHLGLFALVALPLASLWLPSLSIALPEILPASPGQAIAMDPPAAQSPHDSTLAPPAGASSAGPSLGELASLFARYAYALPAIALLALTLVAIVRLGTLRARAQVLVDPHWLGALGRAQRRMNFKSGTALLTSTELQSPISWGLVRPTIVVNEDSLASGEQAEAIIAHELAHVIHLDWAKLMLARIATAVFWFNPLAWVLAREAHQLREEAADDAVLAANVAGPDYAQLLVGVARHENRGLLLGAHGVAPGKGSLRRRIARVLDKTMARGPARGPWVAGFTAGMMVMAAPLAAVTFGSASANGAAPKAPSKASAIQPAAPAAAPRPAALPVAAAHPAAKAALQSRDEAVKDAETTRADLKAHGIDVDAKPDHDKPVWAGPEGPETPAFAEGWARYGAAIGEKYAKAFSGWGAPPAPSATPAAPAAGQAPQPAAPQVHAWAGAPYKWSPGGPGRQGRYGRPYGVTGEVSEAYRKEISKAGFPKATAQELAFAQAFGVTREYIKSMRSAGIKGDLRTFARLRGAGMRPEYVKELRAAGLDGSPDEFIQARNAGLNGAYARAMDDAGLNGGMQDFIRARMGGLPSGFVRNMEALGVEASVEEYLQMLHLGIRSGWVQGLKDQGREVASARELIEIKRRGFRPRPPDSPAP